MDRDLVLPGQDQGFPGCRRLLGGTGFGGQRGMRPVHQRVRWVGVEGDVQEPELAEASLAVLIAGRGHPDHGKPGRGQPGQRVPVQPAGPGRDNRHLSLPGGRHGEQVAEVVAPVQHLRPNLPRLAGLDQRRLPRRPNPSGHQPHLHVPTASPGDGSGGSG